jgi:DNA-binding transcriptional ArsR family regulator
MPTPVKQLRIDDPAVATVLLHPTRTSVLACLRRPASATEVALELGLPPARVNHHVRRLRDARLIRRAGSRRVRNLTETLYIAVARTYVLTEALTPGHELRRRFRAGDAARPLRNLAALGDRLAGDALLLLDEAAGGERDVSSFATSLDLRFPDAQARAAFLADLLGAVKELRLKYGADESAPADPEERYRAVVACYPQTGA